MHPDLQPWPAELNRHRIVLAGRACPRGVRPASSNAAASSSRQVAVAAYGAAAVAAYKCGAVAAYSEVLRASLNDAAASNSEVPRLRLSDSDPETQQLIRETQQSGQSWPAPLQRIRRTCKTRPELDEIARELVLAGRACPRGVRPASSNAAASSSRQVAVAAYGAAAVAAYKCGAVAAYSEVLRASLNDAAASNSEVPRLRLSDSDPETQQLIRETQQSGLARLYQGKQPLRHPSPPKLRRSCADENGCGRCFCDTCYQL